MRDFHDLNVWHKGHEFCLGVYRATRRFPQDERFALTSQCRRAAASIPANIAEGCGRGGERELARYCEIAAGSASEMEYHLLLARDLGYLDAAGHAALDQSVNDIKRMLNVLIRKLESNG